MKYYVQMIIAAGSYTTELDQPQEIKKEEFTQKNINEWCESYIVDYGDGAPDIDCLGFVLIDEDGKEINRMFYEA